MRKLGNKEVVLGRAQRRGFIRRPMEEVPRFRDSSRPSDQGPQFISRVLKDFLQHRLRLPAADSPACETGSGEAAGPGP